MSKDLKEIPRVAYECKCGKRKPIGDNFCGTCTEGRKRLWENLKQFWKNKKANKINESINRPKNYD